MKRLFTALVCTFIGGAAFGQWTPTTFNKVDTKKKGRTLSKQQAAVKDHGYYKLDLDLLRSQLKNTQEMGRNSTPVVISIPTMSGKVEKFNVYSFPVVVKELADQYQLGSYVGAGIDDPTKTIRFSISPKTFRSMVMKSGAYEFIDPQSGDKTVYGIHAKTMHTGDKSFICTTNESPAVVKEVEELYKNGKSFTNQPNDFSKMSDKKYRTMRLALSVTGEYTQYHGGTVAGALDAMNATMTRVNGVFEKDFALHLNLQNFQNLIYLDPDNDPYSDSDDMDNWNVELQNTLTSAPGVGNANYDIGHLFGASGGGGNAGCIGCVCISPTATSLGKGSGYTSPADGEPEGDSFDIDYVAHEMGHQLGANHTFSHALEGSGVNQEPGSGSTIMGYAGITGALNNVQLHSDAYFHIASIKQVQANLISKTCDVETSINNNPPVIAALPTYNIPKGTAFVLTASATDQENDPLTYTWEEVDDAQTTINKNNIGTTVSGASFRSIVPSTNPTRYFPAFTSVLDGILNNAGNTWESVSMRARATKFAVTVRDNSPIADQQQTQYAEQNIIVGNDGPFRLANQYADVNTPTPIQWVVANTNAAPYNVANVKIDYTTNNGTSWTVLSNSTPNDGSEDFTFPTSLNGQTIKVRISSINNVFYAIGNVTIGALSACNSSAPTNVAVSYITPNSANASWMSYTGATYKVRYRKVGSSVWTESTTDVPSFNINGLEGETNYEVQVAIVCNGTTGTYSTSVNFTTTNLYCASSIDYPIYEYISNITVGNINNTSTISASGYSNYTTNTALQINLAKGTSNPISLSIAGVDYDAAAVWIDYNKDGVFTDNEMILNSPVSNTAVRTGSFTVPASAVEGQPLRMRALIFYGGEDYEGATLTSEFTCGALPYGEVEDYNVVIASTLGTSEAIKKDNFSIYPNPVSDILNVTKVSNKATYEIHNTVGQIVKKGTIDNNKVNVTELLKGNYIISVKDNNISESFKFIKK